MTTCCLKANNIFFLLVVVCSVASAQRYAKWSPNGILLDNGLISRYIKLSSSPSQISTASLRLKGDSIDFVSAKTNEDADLTKKSAIKESDSNEFSFELDGKRVTGKSGWLVDTIQSITKEEGNGIELTLCGEIADLKDIKIKITYLLYPDLPVIRKQMTFVNTGTSERRLEALDMEHLIIGWSHVNTKVLNGYARYTYLGPYVGDHNDPAIIVHDQVAGRGMVLGNETPGVLKRTSVQTDGRSFTIGLTRPDQSYPFRKWLKPNIPWESPYSFIALYKDVNPRKIIDEGLSEFTRKYLGTRLSLIKDKPGFVYNTWMPFRRDINERLIRELADAAAASGVEEFIIDDGWETNYGDWEVDKKKFPNGLKPVFDYIRSKGMKGGLWISLAALERNSRIAGEHPGWIVQDSSGNMTNLHTPDKNQLTADITTGWRNYIISIISKYVKDNDLRYVKLDLAIVTSAYIFDRSVSGSYAKGRQSYEDRQESLLEIYRSAWSIFDELHQVFPELFIDCTFETMGAMQLIDYDMCKHAEGNWLSNFNEDPARGSLRVRQTAWQRSPVIPASAMVIGNQHMDAPNALLSFKSLAGSLPIMLGDPRNLNQKERQEFKAWSAWLQRMQKAHDIFMFRQNLSGFGEPQEESWDGFQRINTETRSGGIIGVFRQGAREKQRTIVINYLDPVKHYTVREGVSGKIIKQASGRELAMTGFNVSIVELYGGRLYEVSVSH